MTRGKDTEVFQKVREKDHAVLECIRRGDTDVHSVKEATTLSRREINYAFEKLEDLDVILVQRSDGWTETVVDGQKRKFRTPKQASLTRLGVGYFEWKGRNGDLGRYDALEYQELVDRVHEQERELHHLRKAFKTFRQQVLSELRDTDDTTN